MGMRHFAWVKLLASVLIVFSWLAFGNAYAQVIYAAGGTTNAGPFNRFLILNPTTGVATAPLVANTLPAGVTETVAIGVSPINGLVYWVERAVATPRIGTWNPATGATTIIGNAGTPGTVAAFLRATFCPDGKFYISGNGTTVAGTAQMFEINPTTGALIRTISLTGLPTSGSGDIVCMSNGNMFMVAQPGAANTAYVLYSVTAAQLNTGGAIATNVVGTVTGPALTQNYNGLSERADGQLVMSVSLAATATYALNPTNAVATTLTTAVGFGLVDLSREFPRDLSITKSSSPTLALQGQTLTYTITVNNSGPAVAASVTVADTLNASVFNAAGATWTCTVLVAGSVTAVTTGCGAASGTGNINTFSNLSINGQVQYTLVAPILSSYSGVATNSAALTLTGTTVDPTPANNAVTVTTTVTPAARITIAKDDGTTTVAAGSTTNYTITVVNFGPANAPNSIVKDAVAPGLNCTAATCTASAGAVCPVGTPTALMTSLQSTGGLSIPTFNSGSTVSFVVTCGVTATGQ